MALLRVMNLPPETAVLLPAYVPEGLIAPVRRSRLRVVFYSLKRDLTPDWRVLEERLKQENPKLAVMIHYFGTAQPIRQFCEMCHRHGTLVVEDMAHVLHSCESTLGTSGDFILYSLPKMLGVPDGAPLVVRTSILDPDRFEFTPDYRHTLYVTKQLARLVTSTLYRMYIGNTARQLMQRVVPWRIRKFTDSYGTLMEYFEHPNEVSSVSRYLLTRTDWQRIIHHRRRLAQRYQDKLDPDLFERFPGAADLSHAGVGFPVLIKNRDSLVNHLKEDGIRGVYYQDRWDFFPRNETPVHEEAIKTMTQHFLFPTAQSLSLDEVDFVVKIANNWRGAKSLS